MISEKEKFFDPRKPFASKRPETHEEWQARMGGEVLAVVRSGLYLDFRFLDMALSALTPVPDERCGVLATDGVNLYYQPSALLRLYQENPKYLNRLYLHTVFHCVFRHLWLKGKRDARLWNLACDIAVENVLDSLNRSSVKRPLTWVRQNAYAAIAAEGRVVAAAPAYRWLAGQTPGILRQLLENGMNVARFNFSHGDYAEHKGRLDQLRALSKELDVSIPAMLDTKGPEIRLGEFENGKEQLTAGQKFILTSRNVKGTKEISSITYKDLPHDVSVGGRIMLDDGLISLRIESITDTDIVCTVENDGVIKTKKGVNVPGVHLSMPYMSQRDRDDILFGIEQGYDLISASFTRNAQDIMDIRHLLDEHNANIRIIAKIENQEGIDNIDEILSVADGIMVARGDMGVEIDYAEIPSIQKHLIDHAMQMGKICITATQMLDSMIVNPRPTRAEITDVANAIYDGTGAVMLSGETAAGKYPVEALKAMAMIAETTESDTNYESLCHHVGMDSTRLTISAAVSHAACTTASDIGASAIITASKSGETARLLSRFRPDAPIIACVLDETTCRQMNVYRGVTPLLMDYAHSTDELISMSVKAAEDAGLIHSGDRVVVTAGVPVGVSGTTNMIKVHLVGDTLLTGIGINPGLNAKGEVCVCRNAEEAAKKFKAGQILVVPFTTNDILPYMRQAAGIIAEEAGANSHSAIVGLTLGKPVIIGATHATRTLKDGMKISMDCARGVVQAMSE